MLTGAESSLILMQSRRFVALKMFLRILNSLELSILHMCISLRAKALMLLLECNILAACPTILARQLMNDKEEADDLHIEVVQVNVREWLSMR
jgi:hypothetical protein